MKSPASPLGNTISHGLPTLILAPFCVPHLECSVCCTTCCAWAQQNTMTCEINAVLFN